MARGQSEKAREALEAAHALLTPYSRDTDDADVLDAMIASTSRLCQLHLGREELDDSERYFQQGLELATRLAERTPGAENWNTLANRHNSLGGVAKARMDYVKAAQHFNTSLSLNRRAVAANSGERKYAGGLANSLSWLGDTMARLGRHSDAARHFAEESALLEELRQAAPNELRWTNQLVFALWHQGNTQVDEGKRSAALSSYVRARELMADLALRDPTNQDWQVDLIRLRLREIEAQPMTPKLLEALEGLQQQGIEMSAAEPRNPELRRLVEQLRDSMAGARALVSSR